MPLQGQDAQTPAAPAKYINLTMAIWHLAELAAGPGGRWVDRHGETSVYSADASVARVEQWYTWAAERTFSFTRTLPVNRRPRRKIKLPLFKWLQQKHETLEKARDSGKLLPVDVADQIVRISREGQSDLGETGLTSLRMCVQMEIDIDALIGDLVRVMFLSHCPQHATNKITLLLDSIQDGLLSRTLAKHVPHTAAKRCNCGELVTALSILSWRATLYQILLPIIRRQRCMALPSCLALMRQLFVANGPLASAISRCGRLQFCLASSKRLFRLSLTGLRRK